MAGRIRLVRQTRGGHDLKRIGQRDELACPDGALPAHKSAVRKARGRSHPERLIAACWRLCQHPDYASLRRWGHMLGFGGRFLTKARRYSIRFRDLRQARITYRRSQDEAEKFLEEAMSARNLVLGRCGA